MTPDELLNKVYEFYNELVALDEAERERRLATARLTNPELCSQVERLLRQTDNSWVLLPHPASRSEASASIPEDLLHGRYKLEKRIGQGGFGVVYLASDERLHRKRVVVKLLTRSSHDEWSQKKFRDEIEALARIDHPGVVGILDAGQTGDGTPFIVLQYIDGVTLRSAIASGSIDRKRTAGILRQVGQALAAAHSRGVLHRDLKPENIMLQDSGAGDLVRLIDFGIATIWEWEGESNPTRVAGSMAYMAPEQCHGRPSLRSDIFSMGIIACELLTGKLPVRDGDEIRLDYLRSVQPTLSEDIIQIIAKAVKYNPDERYSEAAEFGELLAGELESAAGETDAGSRNGDAGHPERKTMYDVFVGHSSSDREFCARLVNQLEQRGARCFVAPGDLSDGEATAAAVDEAVQSSAVFLLIVTEAASGSAELIREVESADRNAVPVVALRVDRAEASGLLSFYAPDPRWVDCSGVVKRQESDAIERAIRMAGGRFSGGAQGRRREAGVTTGEPAEPLLSEIGAKLLPGRPGTRQISLVAFFTGWALLTCLLSVLGNAGYITVMLEGPQAPHSVAVRFGYLYELNGAFTFLFIVPFFIYFAVGFVQRAQAAVVKLAMRDQLVVNKCRAAPGWWARIRMRAMHRMPRKDPLEMSRTAISWIGEANRRWMSKRILGFAFVTGFLIIVGTEYLPPKSDYKYVMFGYVQAPWIAEYASVCPGCTLAELERATQRKLEPIGGLSRNQTGLYRIVPPLYRRSGSLFERAAFLLFMVSALGLQVSVGTFIVWTVLKAGFFLNLVYRAIVPSKGCGVELLLRYTDGSRMFGLEPVHRALVQLVGLIGVSAGLQVLAWWSNVLKGSRHALWENLDTLGGWGQFLVANYCLILAILLLVYLFNINAITRESASEEAKRISAASRRGRRPGLEGILDAVERQSIWSGARYTFSYVAAPVVYVLSILILNRPGIAYAAGDVWNAVLSHILGRD